MNGALVIGNGQTIIGSELYLINAASERFENTPFYGHNVIRFNGFDLDMDDIE